MQAIEILVNKKLEKPPLSYFGCYFKVYLLVNRIPKPKEQQTACLNFKIKTQDSYVQPYIIADSIIGKYPVKITGSFIVQKDKYWQAFIEIKNKTKRFTYNFPKNTEIARLYFLDLSYREIIQTIYKLER